jgi:putative ABC transport system permease protein
MVWKEARRFFRSSPLLSLSAVGVLALGFGASALALALLLAFSSPTYPGMRTMGYATLAEDTSAGGTMPVPWKRFEDFRSARSGNANLAAYSRPMRVTIETGGRNLPVTVAAASRRFFGVFTRPLAAGRDFGEVEESRAGMHVVILSFALAVSRFKSPGAALNRYVEINQLPYQVIGVAPTGFDGLFGARVQAWVPPSSVIPLEIDPPPSFPNLDAWKFPSSFYVLAASARSSSARLVAELSSAFSLHPAGDVPLHVSQGLTTDPLRDAGLRKWLRLGLLLALAFTIISSLNYCLLLLSKTPRSVEEARLKRALGAGSGRLVAELMAGPAVSVAGAFAAAVLLLDAGLVLISHASVFYDQLLRGSWHTTLVALAAQVPVACALTLVIGLVPGLALLRHRCVPRLGYTSTSPRGTSLLLQSITTLQMGLCIGAWILAGMVSSAVVSLAREPLGYNPSHLAVVRIGPASGSITIAVGEHGSFPPASAIESLIEKTAALPGVRRASFASEAPLGSPMATMKIQRADTPSAIPVTVDQTSVLPSYFRTLGSRIVLGQDLSPQIAGHENEVVINQSLARELWPDSSPVGRSARLIFPAFGGLPSFSQVATVVGVVGDMRFSGPARSPEPTVFRPFEGGFVTSDLIVSGSESIDSLRREASREVARQVPGLSVLHVYRVADRLSASLSGERVRAYLALAVALSMALVAFLGLYGALAYYVNTRRRELAVRSCLGASPWSIRRLVLARAVRCALSAAILCAPLWPGLAQLSSSEYFGRVSWSTGRAILLSLACMLAAVLISLGPAATTARIPPATVLKEE